MAELKDALRQIYPVISITPLRWRWPTLDRYDKAGAFRIGPFHFYLRYGRPKHWVVQ